MLAIFRKEITGFFSSLTGYIVIIFFLLINSLFMWVLPGEWNIFDSGYAGLDTLFILSPWIFMFLVPAVTMRMIAEEKRLGTIELIFSRPISEREIVYGKYLASVALVLIALLPEFIAYASVYQLGATPGNLDMGGTVGAFIGLFFLAAVYASAGILASSITDNQVIAFIIAVTICFIMFIGFDSFAYLPGLKNIDEVVIRLGINEHYKSISRGVIDIKDIAYYVAVIAVFNELTVLKLQSHKWKNSITEAKTWLKPIITISLIIIVASACSLIRLRADLTEDNRYTLSAQTRNILSNVKNDIYIQVYLDGEIPIPLKRLKRSVREILDEFRISSGRKIDYEFINPSEGKDEQQRNNLYQTLANKGLSPINLQAGDAEGGSTRKIIFPGMIVNFNGIEVPVNFLKNNPAIPYEQNILHSEEGLEYEMIQTIATLSSDTIYKVAFLEGHGEIPEIETADITWNLSKYFTVDRGIIGGKTGVLDNYAAVVIAGPEEEFSEPDKFVLDQYIMNGGRVMWLFEEVSVNSDSLALGETVGLYRPLNLEDQLFRYGARINPAIVQDLDCMVIPLKVVTGGTSSQFVPAPWVYYPKLHPAQNNPITRNINKVKGEFVNFIDTVGFDRNIKKTVLLSSSELAKTLNPPVMISLREAELIADEKTYNKPDLMVAVLLEGIFPSAFKNRMISSIADDKNLIFKDKSIKTKMVVVADADIIRNEVSRSGLQESPVPLGQDKFTGEIFGNRDFLINCINYLVDDKGILELRSRELKLRLLNTLKVKSEKLKWQLINVVGPVLFVILAGVLYAYLRKRKYTGGVWSD
jgi:ABC-2 type transport system permease protein